MLVNSRDLLKNYRSRGKAIAAFNIYNLETIQASLTAARMKEAPLILAFGEGYLSHTSFEAISGIVRALEVDHPHPLVLHLDHCKEIENIERAIEAGFTSVMYDGSHLSLAENMENTRKVVQLAHKGNVTVEGELGYMNPEDGSQAETISPACYTDPVQAKEYAGATGIDSLAVAIGNAHGLYTGEPLLDLDRLREIYEAVNLPLVLHGCSGIESVLIQQAIEIAVAKINVNTEIAMAGARAITEILQANPEKVHRLENLMKNAQQAMSQTMLGFLY